MKPVTLSVYEQVEEHSEHFHQYSEHDDVTGELTFDPFDIKCHQSR